MALSINLKAAKHNNRVKLRKLILNLRFALIVLLSLCLSACGFFFGKKSSATTNVCNIKKSDTVEIITIEAEAGIITKVSLQQSIGFTPELIDMVLTMGEETIEKFNSIPGISASLTTNDDMTMAILSLWLDLTTLDFKQVASQFELLDLAALELLNESLEKELYLNKLKGWGYTCEEIAIEKFFPTLYLAN